MRQVDDEKLRSLLVQASIALQGTGDDLGGIVDDAALLLDQLEEVYPETRRLIDNSAVALRVVPDKRTELEGLAVDARSLAAFLRSYDPELGRFVARAPRQVRQLQALVADVRRTLPEFLSAGVSLTDVLAAHDPHLRALLQAYSPGLDVLSDNIRGGSLQLDLIGDQDRRCDYGTPRRDPRDPTRRPLVEDARCAASFSTLQRGAAHAPGPVDR